MKRSIAIILLLKFSLAFGQQKNDTYKSEPKTIFEVTVNGKKYHISETEQLNLDTLVKPVISIKQSSYKKFENSSYSFSYPRNLSFEYSGQPAIQSWTLNGNSVVIMVFEMPMEIPLQTLTNGMITKFGASNCKTQDFTHKLGDKECKGQTLKVKLVGQNLTLECYTIRSDKNGSSFLIIQDTIENANHSEEYSNISESINSSITYK